MPERSRPTTQYQDACNFFFFTPELKSVIYIPKLEYKYPRAPYFSHGIPFRWPTQTSGFEQQMTAWGSVKKAAHFFH